MGWAKFFEDDIEIMFDRKFMMETKIQETEIKTVCTNVFPFTKVTVELESCDNKIHEQKQYEDKLLMCKDCGRVFVFTAKMQKHYEEKGWTSPKRCKNCREFRNSRYLMCASY